MLFLCFDAFLQLQNLSESYFVIAKSIEQKMHSYHSDLKLSVLNWWQNNTHLYT